MSQDNELLCSIDKINSDLKNCLNEEDTDFNVLKQLVEKREKAIKLHLDNLKPAEAKAFANSQITNQELLQAQLNELLSAAKNELSQSITARKVAAKYK